MNVKKSIGILIMALATCETIAFSYQNAETASAKSQTKQGAVPVEFITVEELKSKIAKNESLTIVDLRAQASFEQSNQTIKGAFHARVRKVVHRLRELPRDKEVVTFCACAADEAAILAAQALLGGGFKRVRVLKGGWNAWRAAGGQLQPKPTGAKP